MKKTLAFLISIMMLVSGCAFAAGTEIILNNLQLYAGEEVIDLSGIDLRLGVAADDVGGGLNLALDAAGNNLLNAVLAVTGEQLLLAADGISDVYGIDLADLAAMLPADANNLAAAAPSVDPQQLAVLETIISDFIQSAEMSEQGVDENGSEIYGIRFSAEAVSALLYGVADTLDAIPQFAAGFQQSSDYPSLRAALDDLGVSLSIDGFYVVAEDGMEYDFYLLADGTPILNPWAALSTGLSEDGTQILTSLNSALYVVEGEDGTAMICADGALVTDAATGELNIFEAYIYTLDETGENADEGAYLTVTNPANNEMGMWNVHIQALDGSAYCSLYFADADMAAENLFAVVLGDAENTFYFGVTLNDDGSYALYGEMTANGSAVGVGANLYIGETDGAWLAVDGSNAVDILSMSQAQLNKLSGEGMALLSQLLSGVVQAVPTIGALLG